MAGSIPANPYDNGKQGLPEPSQAGIWWRSQDGTISNNHFETSRIEG